MSWDSLLALIRRRLEEAIMWCEPGRWATRAPALRPPNLLRDSLAAPPRPDGERQAIVNRLASARAGLLAEQGKRPRGRARGLAGGRLLLFYPNATLFDGAAQAEADYFDAENVPAWGSWVFHFVEGNGGDAADPSYWSYLLC